MCLSKYGLDVEGLANDPGPQHAWEQYQIVVADWMLPGTDAVQIFRHSLAPIPRDRRPRFAIMSVLTETRIDREVAKLRREFELVLPYIDKTWPIARVYQKLKVLLP